jgi:hypothetical protein
MPEGKLLRLPDDWEKYRPEASSPTSQVRQS